MSKFAVGDLAIIKTADGHVLAKVIANRGGLVAPYKVIIIKSDYGFYKVGNKYYKSGRDMDFVERISMSKEIKLGDLVKDAINGYEGIVFGIEPDGDNTFIHFKRTKDAWSLYGNRNNNATNRINLRNIVLLESRGQEPVVAESFVSLEEKVDAILEHLNLEVKVKPATLSLEKKENQ